jgi:uncharacterized protein
MKPTLTVSLEMKSLNAKEFEGHGSIFDNVDLGGDIVLPGAFKRSLAYHRKAGTLPQMFWMHDPSRVPGKWLSMNEDDDGLAVKGVLADTDLGNEIHTLLKMDAVRGLSIGYMTKDMDFDKEGNRLIKEAELWEVSVVSLPMNPLAQVAHVKSRLSADGAYVPTSRELEAYFRKIGCSKKTARTLISKLFDSSGEMPADDDQDETGGMLVDAEKQIESRCDADDDVVLKALNDLNEALAAEEINRIAKIWKKAS